MTDIQVKYWANQETKRSNLAQETETKRHNLAYEGETKRHNVAQEQLGINTLGETIRHNKVTESETKRHNSEGERIAWSTLGETVRHNKQQENIGYINADASQKQAEAARTNARTNQLKHDLDVVAHQYKVDYDLIDLDRKERELQANINLRQQEILVKQQGDLVKAGSRVLSSLLR